MAERRSALKGFKQKSCVKKKAVSSIISGLLVIALALVSIGAITIYFYSGLFYVSQTKQLEQFLAYREAEILITGQNHSYVTIQNAWDHITKLTYLLTVSPSGAVSVSPLNVVLAPGQSYSMQYEQGYSYAFLTAYGNEFWASYVNNPALNKYTLTIEVNAPIGTTDPPVGTYVYPFGSKVKISATPNSDYYFVEWQGSGYGSASGTPPQPTYVYMWSNIVEKAIFGVEIKFSANGLSNVNPNTVVLYVNGTAYPLSSLPVTLKVPYGDTLDYSYISPIYSTQSGVRFVLANTTGLASGRSASIVATKNGQVVANYQKQYELTVSAQPSDGGTTSPSPGYYWLNAGSSESILATPAEGWIFLNWTGSGQGSYTGTSESATITMNSPITETAYFIPIWTIVFNATGLNSNAQGTVLVVNGVSYSYSQLPVILHVTNGTKISYAWTNPVSGGLGTRFVLESVTGLDTAQNGSFTVTQSGYVVAIYSTYYELTMQVSPSGTGTTTPAVGTYWYPAGTQVSISAAPNAGYQFVSWSGSGSGSYTGTNNPAAITMNSPIIETAYFEATYIITFSTTGLNASATGTILTVKYNGTTYNLQYSNLPFALDVVSGSTVSYSFASPIIPSSGSYEWFWTSTSGLSTARSGNITATQSGSITGNYEAEYEYTFVEHYLPSGSTWSVTANGQTYSEPAGTNIVIWSTSNPLPFTASNVTYNGQTYIPTPQSGNAKPGTTNIYYQLSVTGVVGLIFIFPLILAVIREIFLRFM